MRLALAVIAGVFVGQPIMLTALSILLRGVSAALRAYSRL